MDIDKNLSIGKLEGLIKIPIVVRVNNFNNDAAKKFTEDMEAAQNTGQPVIPILIDSYGGEVYSLLAMVDVIRNCKVPVATVVEGKAMSCGAVLATCGAEGMRFMGSNATLMIHDVSSMEFGKNEEIKAGSKECDRLNNLIYKIMTTNTGKEEKYLWNLVQEKGRADWFISPEEAKEHNLINHVRIPNFRVKISSAVTFE